VLKSRDPKTEPKNQFILQVFRLLTAPVTYAPPFNLLPGAQHVSLIADEACLLAQDDSPGVRSLRNLCKVLSLTIFDPSYRGTAAERL
jgi:hypothetical protein